jgi:hypothetical protein
MPPIWIVSATKTADEKQDLDAFKILPFSTSQPSDETLVVRKIDNYPTSYIWLLRGLDWLLQNKVDTISLSVGPASNQYDKDDPIQIATRSIYERNVVLVVAAGNQGPNPNSLRAIARAPSVISVGATDEFRQLLPHSSRGEPGVNSPTVVCDGTLTDAHLYPQRRKYSPGTSFAAAKVAGYSTFLIKCLEIIWKDFRDACVDDWQLLGKPVRLPIVGIADSGIDKEEMSKSLPQLVSMILESGSDSIKVGHSDSEQRWYMSVKKIAETLDCKLNAVNPPDALRRALIEAAEPLPKYAFHEVGAGYLALDQIVQFLCNLTVSRFLKIFGLRTGNLTPDIQPIDESIGRLWSEEKVFALQEFFYSGIRKYVAKVIN